MAAAVALFQGCSKDAENDLAAVDNPISGSELRTILETDQWTGAMDEVLMDLFEKHSGPSAKFSDEGCYEVSYTDNGFRAVFGNCVLNTTDKVNGVLEVVYTSGPEVASFTVTFTDFLVGSAELNGSRTLTVNQFGATRLVFAVQTDMSVLMEDGTLLTESGIKNIEFLFGDSPGGTTYALSGTWTVSIGSTTYGVSVEQPLSGNLQCPWAGSGLMSLDKNGLDVGVDFGDGTCDNRVTIIYPDGATEEVEL